MFLQTYNQQFLESHEPGRLFAVSGIVGLPAFFNGFYPGGASTVLDWKRDALDRPVRRVTQWGESYSGRSGDAVSGRVDAQPPPGLSHAERIAWRMAHAEDDSHAENAEFDFHAENAESAEIFCADGSVSGGASPPGEPLSSLRAPFSPVSTNFYAYDARSQVTNVAFSTSSDAYAYDSIGNRLSSSDLFGARLYDANAVNQYECVSNAVTADAAEPEYDLDGNLVLDGTFEYERDALGRLVGVYGETPEGRPLELLYEYDWRNRLTGKRRRVREASGSWSEEWHEYLWDDWLLLHERIERPDGTVSNLEFVWGRDLSDTFQGAGGVGGLVAVSLDGSYYVPAYDDNGNVIAYFDESGAFAARYEYDAFGNTLSSSGPLAGTFPHRFSTKYYDPDLGLYYYGHRYYSPSLGRWISRDQIEEQGGLNLYSACHNSIFRIMDYLGLAEYTIHAIGDSMTYGVRTRTNPLEAVTINGTVNNLHNSDRVSQIENQGWRGFLKYKLDAWVASHPAYDVSFKFVGSHMESLVDGNVPHDGYPGARASSFLDSYPHVCFDGGDIYILLLGMNDAIAISHHKEDKWELDVNGTRAGFLKILSNIARDDPGFLLLGKPPLMTSSVVGHDWKMVNKVLLDHIHPMIAGFKEAWPGESDLFYTGHSTKGSRTDDDGFHYSVHGNQLMADSLFRKIKRYVIKHSRW